MTDIATKIYNILVNDEDGKLAQEVANVLAQRIAEGLEEPEIVPAGPLTEPLEFGARYYCVTESGHVDESSWDDDIIDVHRTKHKNVFPYTPEGKAGAELRAKTPHPGIHWVDDLRKLKQLSAEAGKTDDWDEFQEFAYEFMDKYLPPTTNKAS